MTQQKERLDFKKLLPILFIVFVDLMGLTIIIPILPYYTLSFNAPPVMIGLVSASYPLMQLIGGPILSSLSDRYGRKPVLAIAQFGTFLSLLTLGFANALWMIILARLLDGITGANLPTVQAAISDQTTPRTRSQGLGLIGAAFGIGFILGPVISGIALSLTDSNYGAPAFVASGFALLSVILTTFVFKETLPPEKRGVSDGRRPRGFSLQKLIDGVNNPILGALFILIFFQQLVFFAFQVMFAPFSLNRLGLNSVGNTIVFVFVGIISVVVQGGLIGRLTEHFGERKLLIYGLSILAVGLVAFGLTQQEPVPWYRKADIVTELQQGDPNATIDVSDQLDLLPSEYDKGYSSLIYALLAIVPIVVGSSVLQPSVNSLITQRVPTTEVGGALGISAAFISLANILGPLWGGAAFDYISPRAPFLIGGIATAVLVPFAIRKIKPIAADSED